MSSYWYRLTPENEFPTGPAGRALVAFLQQAIRIAKRELAIGDAKISLRFFQPCQSELDSDFSEPNPIRGRSNYLGSMGFEVSLEWGRQSLIDLLQTLGHEMRHCWQWSADVERDEADAENWGSAFARRWWPVFRSELASPRSPARDRVQAGPLTSRPTPAIAAKEVLGGIIGLNWDGTPFKVRYVPI